MSTSSTTMSRNNTPISVYKRRSQHTSCHSATSSFFDRTTEAVKSRILHCDTGAISSFKRCPAEETLISSINDNCSSSKSDLESTHSGECSSSNEMSERDICISILRNQGLLDKVMTRQKRASAENRDISKNYYTSKPCKVCEHFDSTSNMLICDNCLDAFHMSCFKPCVTRIPVGEWLCGSCSNKRRKIWNEKSSGDSVNIGIELGRNGNSAPEGELGSVEFMFRENEAYMSNVRIGDEFQASVPDWSGPVYNECDLIVDRVDVDISNDVSLQEQSSCKKSLKLSSIGNWLQCQEFVEGSGEGTICGKWRRAPLFEVQTDDWECFCCVLWDPCRADCAAPQEVDTEEVMKQLKYIEMLRTQLAAKRRTLDSSKTSSGEHRMKICKLG